MGEIEWQRQKAGFIWKGNNKTNHMHTHDVSHMHDGVEDDNWEPKTKLWETHEGTLRFTLKYAVRHAFFHLQFTNGI